MRKAKGMKKLKTIHTFPERILAGDGGNFVMNAGLSEKWPRAIFDQFPLSGYATYQALTRFVGMTSQELLQLASSALACFRIGVPGSAPFQREKKSS